MSITAHTNSPGGYTKSEIRTNRGVWIQRGYIRDGQESFRDDIPVQTDYSFKSDTVLGDRVTATDYSRRVRKLFIDSPESYVETTYADPGNDYYFIRKVDRFISTSYSTMSLPIPPEFLSNLGEAEEEANVKALNRLRSGKVQNGADLAEAKSTVTMIAKDAERILLAYRALKRGNFRFAAEVLGLNLRRGRHGTIADLWLELQYGWKPLMQSIYDNSQHLGRPRPRPTDVVRASGTATRNYKSQRVTPEGFSETWECIGSSRVVYNTKVVSPALVQGDTFGLLNPLEIGWELVPFSFVVDWFIPVGDMLQSISASAGLDLTNGFRSTRYTAVFTSSRNGGQIQVGHFSFERKAFPLFQLPGLYAKSNPFSSQHLTNALALISQHR